MTEKKVRLGGMALSNGVLVHGPSAWACAIRTDEGELKVASGRKRLFAPGIQQPILRGPLRLAEAFAMIPDMRRRLPEARLPFERPSVLAATVASAVTVQAVRQGEVMHFLFSWPDATRSVDHLPMIKTAEGWVVQMEGFLDNDERRYHEGDPAAMVRLAAERIAHQE